VKKGAHSPPAPAARNREKPLFIPQTAKNCQKKSEKSGGNKNSKLFRKSKKKTKWKNRSKIERNRKNWKNQKNYHFSNLFPAFQFLFGFSDFFYYLFPFPPIFHQFSGSRGCPPVKLYARTFQTPLSRRHASKCDFINPFVKSLVIKSGVGPFRRGGSKKCVQRILPCFWPFRPFWPILVHLGAFW